MLTELSSLTAIHQPYPPPAIVPEERRAGLYPLTLGKGKGRRFERGASAPLKRPALSLWESGIMGVRVLVIRLTKSKI